jgi:hypothetical protein
MSTRAGEPSVGMIPRITGGLDSTGCSDHRTRWAENNGPICWPGTIGPPQRGQMMGGKLLGGFVCLRLAPRGGFFGVRNGIVAASIDEEKNTANPISGRPKQERLRYTRRLSTTVWIAFPKSRIQMIHLSACT